MPAVFVPNRAGLAELLSSPTGPVAQDLLRRLVRIHARAVALAPVRTGRLRSSIRFGLELFGGALVGVVECPVEYALPIHEGSRPHEIVPRNKSVLRFQAADGRVVFARRVMHPGNRATPFLRNALLAEAV